MGAVCKHLSILVITDAHSIKQDNILNYTVVHEHHICTHLVWLLPTTVSQHEHGHLTIQIHNPTITH